MIERPPQFLRCEHPGCNARVMRRRGHKKCYRHRGERKPTGKASKEVMARYQKLKTRRKAAAGIPVAWVV